MRHLDRPGLAGDHTLVYVPCHRNHIDYLLLSYVLFYGGVMLPHIAAGNNLNLPVAGPCYGEASAFFMRRKFAGDALYTAVFESYVDHLFTHGFAVEYFVEGTEPKRPNAERALGMLRMTLGAITAGSAVPWPLCPCISATSASLKGEAI